MCRSKRSARTAARTLFSKFGRFGEFVACSSYPTCKYVKQKTIGVKCPNCSEGEIVERRSQARQDVLRLQSLSGVRFRGLGQADCRSSARSAAILSGREVAEGRPGRAVPESGVQVQARLAEARAGT